MIMNLTPEVLAASYLFTAREKAELASKLVVEAKNAFERGDLDGARDWLEQAKVPLSYLDLDIGHAIHEMGRALAEQHKHRMQRR